MKRLGMSGIALGLLLSACGANPQDPIGQGPVGKVADGRASTGSTGDGQQAAGTASGNVASANVASSNMAPDNAASTGAAAESKSAEAAPRLGGDRDKQGCLTSAGYTYSHVHGKCIRVFEVGIRLNAKAKSVDATQSAFAVLMPGDDGRAELFLPGRAPAILARDGDKQSWRDGAYVLTRAGKTYTLSETGGKVLYAGSAK